MTDDIISRNDEGFDTQSWTSLEAFNSRIATQADVDAAKAVFAVEDAEGSMVVEMDLPQPVIWWAEDGERAAVIVQAELHTLEADDDDVSEVYGLVLVDGTTVVVLGDEVDLVDASDPVWQRLTQEEIQDLLDEEDEDSDAEESVKN